jgi:CheY-like chemotaxis protein
MDNSVSKTILIGATDPNIIYLLQRYAEASGYQTAHSGFGDCLIKLARQVHPILVVLQIDPPESTWQESLKMLKDEPITGCIPIIAYSCIDEMLYRQVDGITSILQKSVLYSDFLIALERAGVHTR